MLVELNNMKQVVHLSGNCIRLCKFHLLDTRPFNLMEISAALEWMDVSRIMHY